jgi:hypothetical protein
MAALLAGLAVVVLLTSMLTWGALALALRGLESVWHDRVEALEFIHGVVTPIERTVPVIARRLPADLDATAAMLDSARESSIEHWGRYLATYFTTEESRLAGEVAVQLESVHASMRTLSQQLRASDTAGLERTVDDAFLPALAELSAGIEPLVRLQAEVTRDQVEATRSRHAISRTLLIASAVATLALLATVMGGAKPVRKRWRK